MSEHGDRVVRRVTAALEPDDSTPLPSDDAAADAWALLCEVTPSPEQPVDLGSVHAVCWTFALRLAGTAGRPDAQQDIVGAMGTAGFLLPRLPDTVPIPAPLRAAISPADPALDARFACLVGAAHAELATTTTDLPLPQRLAGLDRALAWTKATARWAPDEELLTTATLAEMGQWRRRFNLAADPDALATAARHAVVAFPRIPLDKPERAPVVREVLDTIVTGSLLLGEPSLEEVERHVGSAPPEALSPTTTAALEQLRSLHAEPVSWPGALDARVGMVLADPRGSGHDAGVFACAARRLRTALRHTSPGHPGYATISHQLGQVLITIGRERDDHEAAREGAEIVAGIAPEAVVYTDQTFLAGLMDLATFMRHENANVRSQLDPLLDRLLAQAEAITVIRSGLPGLPPELRISVVLIGSLAEICVGEKRFTEPQIDRYNAALDKLPATHSHRYAYTTVLAAMVGLRSDTPPQTGRLRTNGLIDAVVAGAPEDFAPLDLLRRGHYALALIAGMSTLPSKPWTEEIDRNLAVIGSPVTDLAKIVGELGGAVTSTELDTLGAVLSVSGDPATDPDGSRLATGVARLRSLLGDDLTEPSPHQQLVAAVLGPALVMLGAKHDDLALFDEGIDLLRNVHSRTPQPPEWLSRALARALTTSASFHFEPEAAREASALIAGRGPSEGTTDIVSATRETEEELFREIANYVHGHDVGSRARVTDLVRRLNELADKTVSNAGDRMRASGRIGDAFLNLLEVTGPGGGPKFDIRDEDVDRSRNALAAFPAGEPARGLAQSALIVALAQRATVIRPLSPDRATELLAEADELMNDVEANSGLPGTELLRFLIERFKRPRETDRVPDGHPLPAARSVVAVPAMEEFLTIVRSGDLSAALRNSRLSPFMRAHAGIGAAAGALARGPADQASIVQALSYAEEALDLMSRVTDRGSDQLSAEHGLTSFEGDLRAVVELVLLRDVIGQAGQALAEHVAAGHTDATGLPGGLPSIGTGSNVDRATALLERGRGLLLARQLEAHADLSELRAEHPLLADRFEVLTRQLAAGPAALAQLRPQDEPPVTGYAEWARLAKLRVSREFDELTEQIRNTPGFDGFLWPPDAQRLRELAADGPIVVLSQGPHYSHALVVTGTAIRSLRLDVESAEVIGTADRLREAIDVINARGRHRLPLDRLIEAGAAVRESLSWTWHRVVQPVLDLVDLAEAATDDAEWPRVWWVPTAAFNALPLHAATCMLPDCDLDDCGSALDAVVSSYVANIQILAHVRGRAAVRRTTDGRRALIVAAAEDDLPGAADAAGFAADRLGAPPPLVGTAATRDAVLASLKEATWVHFGCHATSNPAQPSSGLLHLPSGQRLSILEICRARTQAARLAFLAACGTARTSHRLADEAIHLTSAFLAAGFIGAVGTLWEIDSREADNVTSTAAAIGGVWSVPAFVDSGSGRDLADFSVS